MIIPVKNFQDFSETWLIERTYHAQLRDGSELSVANLTMAMKQLSDISVPLSSQSAKSELPESLPRQEGSTFSVPISTWEEITQKEAQLSYQQGKPVLLYSEHIWKHSQKNSGLWGPDRNMSAIIYGNMLLQPEATSGSDYAVCYLDAKQGIFSNASWKMWFSSDPAILFDYAHQPITFFRPSIQFPFTTHYTVIASDGQISEYPGHAEALQGFETDALQEVRHGNDVQTIAPHFSYYHEVTFPNDTYRLEFFGQHMNEQGYMLTEQPS